MAFKSIKEYNEERFANLFTLRGDGDSADVVFLYPSAESALVASVHYIKTADYTGYVHCCGRNCPACAKGIHTQMKLFIPLYNINSREVQFWDRSSRFDVQLAEDVFNKFPNPSEYVFRITRQGAARDINTTYQIVAIGRNTDASLQYSQILADNQISLPDYYSTVCKDMKEADLYSALNTSNSSSATVPTDSYTAPNYAVTPRSVTSAPVPPDNYIESCCDILDGADIPGEINDNVTF